MPHDQSLADLLSDANHAAEQLTQRNAEPVQQLETLHEAAIEILRAHNQQPHVRYVNASSFLGPHSFQAVVMIVYGERRSIVVGIELQCVGGVITERWATKRRSLSAEDLALRFAMEIKARAQR